MLTVKFPAEEDLRKILIELQFSELLINKFIYLYGGKRLSIHSIQVKYHELKHELAKKSAKETIEDIPEPKFRKFLNQCGTNTQLINNICGGLKVEYLAKK